MTDEELINMVIAEEGGPVFTENPLDPPTRCGITLDTFQDYYPGATVEDLKTCRLSTLRDIYQRGYLDRVKSAPKAILPAMFSAAVNCGVPRAVKILQKSLNATIPPKGAMLACDGKFGTKTQAAVEVASATYSGDALAALYVREWMDFYMHMGSPKVDIYRDGWINRALAHLPRRWS